jgi:hypothetical protein
MLDLATVLEPLRIAYGRIEPSLFALVMVGCGRTGSPDSGCESCDDSSQPERYTNSDFETADCALTGLASRGLESSETHLTKDQSIRMSYTVAELDQLYPNRFLFVNWYGDRGADLCPGAATFGGEPMQEAPLYAYALDCPGTTTESCTRYLSRSGLVSFSDGGDCPYVHDTSTGEDRLIGFLDQVVLDEVTVDEHAGTSAWVPGGRSWCFEYHHFDVEQW